LVRKENVIAIKKMTPLMKNLMLDSNRITQIFFYFSMSQIGQKRKRDCNQENDAIDEEFDVTGIFLAFF
jgi:hypothetical protein